MATGKRCAVAGCQKPHYGHGFCEKHYQRFKKYGNAQDKPGDHTPLEAKFWPNVHFGAECWTWKGPLQKGYGRVWWRGETMRAHRAAWLLTQGEIPLGLFVCHRCDNPPCVRPEHLFLGTDRENTADRVAKGRCAKLDRRGVLGGRAKLSENQVLAIRASTLPQRQIALEYGLDASTVSDIRRRKSWTHI